MEAGSHRVEPDEDGHRAVRLRPRLGEEAVGNLALHHHAPRPKCRSSPERLRDDRRPDVVREVRDELGRRRLEGSWVEGERVTEVQVDIRSLSDGVPERRLERPVELDCVDVPHAISEEGREHAEARADLERDVGGLQAGEPLDDAEQVAVDQEVLAERALRRDGPHGRSSPNAAVALASIRASSSSGDSFRASAKVASV